MLNETFEVQVVYAGAAEREEFFTLEDAAFRFAENQRKDCAAAAAGHGSDNDVGEDWAIYVLPHYCAGLGECDCRQYDTDHRPWASSDEGKEL